MLRPGDTAPDFQLANHREERISLADQRGRHVLLYWYPKADTPGCAAQAQGIRDQQDAFDELGCTVYGASFDQPADNAAFHEKYRLTFDLLSDPERTTGQAYGVAGDDGGASYAQRTAYLIDPEGVIAQVYEVDAPEFFAERVLDDLEPNG